MGKIRDVDVIITRETQAVTQAGFGLPLILATSKEHEYTLYTDIAAVADDFAEETEEYKMAARVFGQTPSPQRIAIAGIVYGTESEPAELIAELNALLSEGKNDWYFLLCPEQSDEVIQALADWIDTQEKLYFAATDNVDLPGMMESERTALMLHSNPEDYPEAGWVGRCAPELPGSITWKFKTINGIGESGFGETQMQTILDDGGNVYIRQGGILMSTEGVVTSGEYIDVMRGVDFIKIRMQEEVFGTLVRAPKIPFTDEGIAIIVGSVSAVLARATDQGIIARDIDRNPLFEIEYPSRDDVSQNDRADRKLPDISWDAELAGAIHKTEISGVVRV